MIRSVVLALILLVTTSAASLAQGKPGQERHEDPGPIGTLMLWRAEIDLTESQFSRLAEIEASVDRQNQQPLEQLTEIRRDLRRLGPRHRLDSEGIAQYNAYMASMRPLAKQLETNMHKAMAKAIGVLTDAQRREVWQMMQQQERGRDRDRNSRSPRSSGAGN